MSVTFLTPWAALVGLVGLLGAVAYLRGRRRSAAVARWSWAEEAAKDRLNVVFIMTDQQCVDALSAAGNTTMKTPALDRLAAAGLRFTKSYCTHPLCSPSRASLFTSRMPHELGVNSNVKASIPADVPTMGTVFRAAGYETVYTGKWHLPMPYPALMPQRNRTEELVRGFRVLPVEHEVKLEPDDSGRGHAIDGMMADAAVKYLKNPPSKPFLLVVSLLNPHDICGASRRLGEYLPRIQGVDLPPLPANFSAVEPELPSTGRRARSRKSQEFGDWTEKQWREYRAVYAKLMEEVDGHIGRVLAALDEAKLNDRTLIVFTSDHGEMLGSHQLVHKLKLYEESAAVPVIVCAPGGPRGQVDREHLVSGLDILPTLCDYAGVPPPAGAEGRSLRPLVEGKKADWRDHLVVEVGASHNARMVRTARHKYVVFAQPEAQEQLFDLQEDRGETKNLAADEKLKPVLQAHRAKLQAWMKQTKDPFVFPPEFKS